MFLLATGNRGLSVDFSHLETVRLLEPPNRADPGRRWVDRALFTSKLVLLTFANRCESREPAAEMLLFSLIQRAGLAIGRRGHGEINDALDDS